MELLSDNERDIICKNWNNIKINTEKNNIYETTFKGLKIYAINREDFIELNIIKELNIVINIDKKAKIIKFKYNSENELKERDELIYEPEHINILTKYYRMEHPVYSYKEKDRILNISVDNEKLDLIFKDPKITEIYDDRFELYINEKKFREYKNKILFNASDYYDEFSINEYSKIISNDKLLVNQNRYNLMKFLRIDTKQKIIFLIGCQKIGLTLTIKSNLKVSKILYINFEDLHKIIKARDKSKYLFYMLINLFDNYSEYNNFINKNIFDIKGYDDILNIINIITIKIRDYLNNSNINIILDNYDDHLVGNLKLSKNYIEDLYKIIQNSNIRIIILGRGLFISDLFIKYFYTPYKIEHFILFKYYISLNLDIENIIHNYNKEKNINEVENYYKKKFKNEEYALYNFIIINNFPNIIKEFHNKEIPFQFFKFQQVNNELKIDFQHKDLLDINNKKIREYMAKLNILNIFSTINNQVLKGTIFEELVVSIFMNNKSFKNLNFSKDNILEVENLYDMKNIISKKCEDGPILIIQKEKGEVFDFGIVFNHINTEYFIGVQVGINKTDEKIFNYIKKLEKKEKQIINNVSLLTKRNINQFRFLIILNEETQRELKEKYDNIYSELSITENKANYEKNLYEEKRGKLNFFNSNYGIACCQKANITFYLFSIKDLCFYQSKNKKIENFDVEDINCINKGFENFCNNEYHLIYISPEEKILSKQEKKLLLESLKTIDSDIEDITINHKINDKLPLLIGTPSDCAILSITKEIKVLTYFKEKYIHFLIQNNEIKKYNQNDELFDNKYNSNYILNRYFVKFKIKEEKLEENENIIKKYDKKVKKKELREENCYENSLRFINRKRKKK